MDPSGKTTLLTGATGGIGRAIAEALAERGATLVLSSRKPAELEQLAGSLPGSGHRFVVADLSQEGAPESLVAEAGAVDVLVANAGLSASGRLETFSDEELTSGLRVNLEAPVKMTWALLPGMLERGQGHIVLIASLQAKAAMPRSAVYSATKFGLRGFALSLREDVREAGVGVSVVLPGLIREAGIFARSGARAPISMGTSSPAEVGAGVIEAIERNRAEVAVAPLRQRLGAGIAHRYPQLSSRLSRGRAAKVADQVVEGRRMHG